MNSNVNNDRFVGILLGTAVGDILGSGVEGVPAEEIADVYGEVRDFLHSGGGLGCYTDDTEMTLALARSIVDCGGVNGEHCAQTYAAFIQPWRGYGRSARAVLNALKRGGDYTKTGRMVFGGGSYGNGGAMRIAPVGAVYRHYRPRDFKRAVFEAIRCTHVHPEAIDGALVQARTVATLLNLTAPEHFDPGELLDSLLETAETKDMKEKITFIQGLPNQPLPDREAVARLGNGVRASEAVPCVLLAITKYHRDPEEAVIKSVNFGGDTDTIGAMTGAAMGALHGKHWLPARWLNKMENDTYGRDYIVNLGNDLAGVRV